MIGERENNFNETEYGSLVMRPYNISGNDIDAFYDSNNDLVFVLDKTINETKPNVLLVMNPDGDRKWDEILSSDYGVDLENIRPKQDNKYQKLDIEYSGLSVYGNLINAYVSGDAIDENLNQLNILRNSAARHSAVERLNAANEIISRTNVTIVKTKESIVRLETRLKTLRAKLAEMKKEIGRVAPKQSAAKILRTESQIDSTKEKIKRAKKRLESAEKRLETATIDAKLASDLLNQPSVEINRPVKNKPMMVAPKHEIQTIAPDDNDSVEDRGFFDDIPDDDDDEAQESDENEVKPLLEKDPEIMNDDIAFKPINFDTPDLPMVEPAPAFPATLAVPTYGVEDTKDDDVQEDKKEEDINKESETVEQPVLESLTPVMNEPLTVEQPMVEEPVVHEEIKEVAPFNLTDEPVNAPSYDAPEEKTVSEKDEPADNLAPIDIKPVPADTVDRPLPPVGNNNLPPAPVVAVDDGKSKTKSSLLYYMLLLVLIALSVFALWMYQKNIGNMKPLLSIGRSNPVVEEPAPVATTEPADVTTPVVQQNISEDVFVDEPNAQESDIEPAVIEPTGGFVEDTEPFIMDAVSEKISAFSNVVEPENVEPQPAVANDVVYEPVVNKPEYGAGAKREDMFVYESDVFVDDMEYDEEYSEPVGGYVEPAQPVYYQPDNTQPVDYVDDNQYGFVDENGVQMVIDEYGNVVYPDEVFYDNYDPEEAAYQAGDDGYDEYR